ncbi:MAG: beta-ketoacyl-[acyl-carrier-protein] synthase family protein [Planctomycetaceae bacterium]
MPLQSRVAGIVFDLTGCFGMIVFQPPSARRVVVTGLGVASPLGCDVGTFWQSLVEEESGISWLDDAANVGDGARVFGGAVRDFAGTIDDFGELEPRTKKAIRKALKVMNRETQLALAAAQHAVADSRLAEAGFDPERVGVCFGADNVSILPDDFLAGIESCTDENAEFVFDDWGTQGLPLVQPLWLLKCLPNMPACYIAIYNDFRGPNNSITQRESSANLAVVEAAGLISDGSVDAIVTGGTGTTIQPFNRLRARLADNIATGGDDPSQVCRPFDKRRSGSVIAEGAAAFVLEEMESAVRRNATIYGEVLGGGSSCVARANGEPLAATALSNAMRSALRNARFSPDLVGHVHAHGLSTPVSDREEFRAFAAVFGERATWVPVVAAKSYTGNAGAGSGAMELAASLLAMQHGRLFPILNYQEADPDCPVAAVRSPDCDAGLAFLNVSMSPEGQASCLAVGKAA